MKTLSIFVSLVLVLFFATGEILLAQPSNLPYWVSYVYFNNATNVVTSIKIVNLMDTPVMMIEQLLDPDMHYSVTFTINPNCAVIRTPMISSLHEFEGVVAYFPGVASFTFPRVEGTVSIYTRDASTPNTVFPYGPCAPWIKIEPKNTSRPLHAIHPLMEYQPSLNHDTVLLLVNVNSIPIHLSIQLTSDAGIVHPPYETVVDGHNVVRFPISTILGPTPSMVYSGWVSVVGYSLVPIVFQPITGFVGSTDEKGLLSLDTFVLVP